MPSPTTSVAVVRTDLATLIEADLEEMMARFIWPRVFPVTNVAAVAGQFGRISIEELLKRAPLLPRRPGTGYFRRNFQFTPEFYSCQEYGVEEPVDDRERQMYGEFVIAERFATMRALHTVLQNAEERVAAKVADFATYDASASLKQTVTAGQWTTVSSKPVTDVKLAAEKVRANTGVWPNAVVMNRHAFRACRLTTQVIDAVASQGAGNQARQRDITVAQLAACFDLDYVLVGDGAKNTAGPGSAATIADIWPNHVMVTRIAESQDMSEPCIGRTFHWGMDGSLEDGRVESYRDETIRAEIVRVRHDVDEKRLYTEMSCMIPNAI